MVLLAIFSFSSVSADNQFVVAGLSGNIGVSSNGSVWTVNSSAAGSDNIWSLTYSPLLGQYAASTTSPASTVRVSYDGLTWNLSESFSSYLVGIAWIEGLSLYVALGEGGYLVTSSDGYNWTNQTTPTSNVLDDVIWADDAELIIAVGRSGTLITSPDGENWTSQTSGFGSTDIRGIGYNNDTGQIVIVGNSGLLSTSTNGVNWTSRTSDFGTSGIRGVHWGSGAGVWVAVGQQNRIATSSDGVNWTNQHSQGTTSQYLMDVSYSDELGLWIAVGDSGLVLKSNNSQDWSTATTSFGSVALRSSIWVSQPQQGIDPVSLSSIELYNTNTYEDFYKGSISFRSQHANFTTVECEYRLDTIGDWFNASANDTHCYVEDLNPESDIIVRIRASESGESNWTESEEKHIFFDTTPPSIGFDPESSQGTSYARITVNVTETKSGHNNTISYCLISGSSCVPNTSRILGESVVGSITTQQSWSFTPTYWAVQGIAADDMYVYISSTGSGAVTGSIQKAYKENLSIVATLVDAPANTDIPSDALLQNIHHHDGILYWMARNGWVYLMNASDLSYTGVSYSNFSSEHIPEDFYFFEGLHRYDGVGVDQAKWFTVSLHHTGSNFNPPTLYRLNEQFEHEKTYVFETHPEKSHQGIAMFDYEGRTYLLATPEDVGSPLFLYEYEPKNDEFVKKGSVSGDVVAGEGLEILSINEAWGNRRGSGDNVYRFNLTELVEFNQTQQTLKAPITITEAGEWTLCVYAEDNLGNNDTECSETGAFNITEPEPEPSTFNITAVDAYDDSTINSFLAVVGYGHNSSSYRESGDSTNEENAFDKNASTLYLRFSTPNLRYYFNETPEYLAIVYLDDGVKKFAIRNVTHPSIDPDGTCHGRNWRVVLWDNRITMTARTDADVPCYTAPNIGYTGISGTEADIEGIYAVLGGTLESTSNGTIVTNETNVFVYSDSYLTFDQGLSLTGSFTAELVQAYASFSCLELYTNDTLTCAQPGPHIRKAGSFTDDVNVTGYYPVSYSYTLSALDNETFNVEGFYDHQLTINASDYNGTALTNFTLSVESTISSFNVTDNNTGTVVLPLVQGYLYNVTISQNVPEGVDRNNSVESETFNITTSSESYQFNLTFPRLFINVYDEQTNLFVTDEPTTITFSKGNSSFSLNTTTGRLNLTGLDAIESGSYSVLFENSAYNPRTYSLTYSRTYAQTLNAYLVPLSAPSTIFTIEDSQSRSPVEGATVTIQRYVNGTLTTVLTRDSDITGRVGFDYIPDRRYEFTIAKTGYATRSFNLDPILFSSYTILLEPSVSFGEIGGDFSGVSIIFSTNRFTESQTNNLTLSFSDSTGGLVSYGYNVSTTTTGQLTSQSGSNAYGSILPSSFAIPDVPLHDQLRVTYYYERSDGIVRTFTTSYSITQVNAYQNQTWVNNRQIAENIAPLDRAAIVVIATGALSALAFTFVGLGGASLSAIVLLGFFAYSGFINGWIVAISIIGFMFLLLGRGSQ